MIGLVLVPALVACGGDPVSAFSSNDGGASDVDNGSDSPFNFGDGAKDGTSSCTKCSPDLHSVLDCNDNVITTCPGDRGCGAGGTCVAACDSAAQNKSSIGCDYFAIPADGWSNIPEFNAGTSDGSCFAAFVTNTWGSPIKVSLEYNGANIDATPFAYIPNGSGNAITYAPVPSTGIPANQMAIVFLSHHGQTAAFKTLCPNGVTPAITNVDVGVHGTAKGPAIRLKTTVPSVVYDIYPYGGALTYTASATLLLPTSVWDTNYLAVSAWHANNNWPMNIGVIAQQDGTQVTIAPTEAIAARGAIAGSPKGTPITYNLNKGELLQFAQLADLSGSPIQSNFPIGVWGGHYCMNIPDGSSACDAAHQEIPPVKALGNEYVALAHRPRTVGDNPPWRILGAVDGTTLSYDPPVAGAPATLASGQLVEFPAPGPFVVKSQDDKHPFYFAGHMTGASTGGGGSMGDPETVNVVPPQQFLASYIFFTDPTYAETNLSLVRKKTAQGFRDVTLDCLGVVGGWAAVGGTDYQWARVDLQKNHAKVGACDNGRHEIKSDAPFGITVWGFDTTVSYAYPAGASVRPINNFIVPPTPK
ncbi:hypothetical protein BH09MYX1_BH09MYX1_22910 [soil metagenome]